MMFRTISKPAMRNYDLFKSMIITTRVASLLKMLHIGYEYAIMASPSSGIYADLHQSEIQKEYHEVCLEALKNTYTHTKNRFKEVIIPKY